MNFSLPRRPATLIVATALASTLGAGLPGAIAASAVVVTDHDCAYYELSYEQARPVVVSSDDPRCPQNAAVEAAAAEAQGWPNFDPIAIGDHLEVARAARIEAATWPDFDPTDMSQEVAATEARDEASGWPNFDSTAISAESDVDIASNSPRMTQVAANASSDEVASGAVAPANHAQPF